MEVRLLFSNSVASDVFFMEYLCFETDDSRQQKLEKYKKWGGRTLYSLAFLADVSMNNSSENGLVDKIIRETLKFGVKLWGKFGILKQEVSRVLFRFTIVHQSVYPGKQKCSQNLSYKIIKCTKVNDGVKMRDRVREECYFCKKATKAMLESHT